MTVSHLVSQGSLITANNNDKCFYDNQIDDFINSISDIAKDETDLFKMCSLAVQIDQGVLIQEKESRTFLVDLFKDEAKKQSISNRELVLRELNATAFLNYYTLLESSIKKMYFDVLVVDENTKINGGEIIEKILDKILSQRGIKHNFETQLALRSKFFLNFNILITTWKIINKIRIRKIHYNSFFNAKDVEYLKKQLNSIVSLYMENEYCSITLSYFYDKIDEIIAQIEKDGYIIFNDVIENIIRNTSIYIMETLYLVYNFVE